MPRLCYRNGVDEHANIEAIIEQVHVSKCECVLCLFAMTTTNVAHYINKCIYLPYLRKYLNIIKHSFSN